MDAALLRVSELQAELRQMEQAATAERVTTSSLLNAMDSVGAALLEAQHREVEHQVSIDRRAQLSQQRSTDPDHPIPQISMQRMEQLLAASRAENSLLQSRREYVRGGELFLSLESQLRDAAGQLVAAKAQTLHLQQLLLDRDCELTALREMLMKSSPCCSDKALGQKQAEPMADADTSVTGLENGETVPR